MASTSDIYTLLRLYAKKQHRSLIPFDEFCAYLKKYAQHYASEQAGLAVYTEKPQEPLQKEIEKLNSENKIILKQQNDQQIIVISVYFKDNIVARYKQISERPDAPYPIPQDLPQDFPQELISTGDAAETIYRLLDGSSHGTNVIYSIVFKREISPVLLPEGVSIEKLLSISVAKLRDFMRHSEQHDYFQQKLLTSNGGKEISVKNFFTHFISNEEETLRKLKEAGDSYYYWNQLLLFVRHDFEKIKDRSPADIALLQAVYIVEICVAYYKNRSSQNLQRETALRNLEQALAKPPFYFDNEAISKFSDTRGVPLLGQYSEEDLNEYLRGATTNSEDGKMPPLLTFKTIDGTRYYVLHEKVLPLTMKLCTDIRKRVHDHIVQEWYGAMQRFTTLPAMKDLNAFNTRLAEIVQEDSPVLSALLNSPFLSSLYYEALEAKDSAAQKFKMFEDGTLVTYGELLMITPHTVMTDAKILLPVWYTIPFLSRLISFFKGGKKNKAPKKAKKKEEKKKQAENQKKIDEQTNIRVAYDDKPATSGGKLSKKDDFKLAAANVEKQLVPPDSSLDSELTSYLNEWNHLLDKTAKKNLTEDVNSLVRDYLRKIIRTSSPAGFTIERVQELATTLVKTPALQKISDQDNLQMYVQLYILRLIKKA